MRRVLYPGTFDPSTWGHLHVVTVGSRLFDDVLIAVMTNPRKLPMFTLRERQGMIQAAVDEAGIGNVEVVTSEGLTVELARELDAVGILRGVRLITDYDTELQMSFVNHKLDSSIYTIWVPPLQEHLEVNSTLVRELLSFGRKVDDFVPPSVTKYIREHK